LFPSSTLSLSSYIILFYSFRPLVLLFVFCPHCPPGYFFSESAFCYCDLFLFLPPRQIRLKTPSVAGACYVPFIHPPLSPGTLIGFFLPLCTYAESSLCFPPFLPVLDSPFCSIVHCKQDLPDSSCSSNFLRVSTA